MSTSDYMRIISEYIIDKTENNTDMASVNFNIKSVNENGKMFYTVEECNIQGNMSFYLKFPCKNKAEFYEAVNSSLVQYFKANNSLLYSAMALNSGRNEKFIMSTNTGVNINLGINDIYDEAMYSNFKEYLDEETKEETVSTVITPIAKKLKKVPELVVI